MFDALFHELFDDVGDDESDEADGSDDAYEYADAERYDDKEYAQHAFDIDAVEEGKLCGDREEFEFMGVFLCYPEQQSRTEYYRNDVAVADGQ